MKPGTRIAGRWVVDAEIGGDPLHPGEVRRFRVRDGDTVAEAIVPAGHALMRPGVRDAFLAVRLPDHPAALGTLATDVVDGVPVRVRPATTGTLDGVRLTAAQAAAAAGWLGPALLAAGGAGLGELGPEDLVRDADGIVRLAPTGVPRVESVARVPRNRAPEGTATPEADLYGLGVTLYRAVTGAWPNEARTPASAHGAGPDADAILDGLLSTEPAARRAAIAGLPAEPVHVPLAEAAAARTAPTSTIKTTVSAAAGSTAPTGGAPGSAPGGSAAPGSAEGRAPAGGPIRTTVPSPAAAALPAGRALQAYAVLVPLKGLSPAALRVVATRSASDPDVVRRAAAHGEIWAIDSAATEAEATRIRARLDSAGIAGVRVALTKTPAVIQFVLLAIVAGVVAIFSGLPLVFGGIAVVLLYLAAVNLKAMFATVETRNALQERDRAALPAGTPETRLRALRRRVADAVLPGIVLTDLRTEVARAEERLDTARAHEAELTDAAAADLVDRRKRVAAELAEVEASITDLEASLTRALTAELDEELSPSATGAATERAATERAAAERAAAERAAAERAAAERAATERAAAERAAAEEGAGVPPVAGETAETGTQPGPPSPREPDRYEVVEDETRPRPPRVPTRS